MIPFNPPELLPHDEVLNSFAEVLESGVITNNGPMVRALETELSERTRTNHALTTCNGTLGLHLSIRALKLKGEIITTPFTFVATASSIIWEGCTPVFVDIDPETFCLDPAKIAERITSKTVAILPVHIYGNVCNIEEIESIAAIHGLPTIYDAAQAYGSEYRGRSVLSYGTISVLSSHAYKIFNTIEGGVVFCNDQDIYDNLFRIRYFGKEMDNREVMPGINAKMSEFNAAYGHLSLTKVDEEIRARRAMYQRYLELLSGLPSLGFQSSLSDAGPNCAYFPLLMPTEELTLELLQMAKDANIGMRRYFYPVLNSLPFLGGDPAETPIAADIASRILCIPHYGSLTEKEQLSIVKVITDLIS